MSETPIMTADDVQAVRYQLQNWARGNWDSAELLRLIESHEELRAEVARWQSTACSWMHTASTDLERALDAEGATLTGHSRDVIADTISEQEEEIERLRARLRVYCLRHHKGLRALGAGHKDNFVTCADCSEAHRALLATGQEEEDRHAPGG